MYIFIHFIHFIIIIIIQSFSLQEENKTKHAKKKGGIIDFYLHYIQPRLINKRANMRKYFFSMY